MKFMFMTLKFPHLLALDNDWVDESVECVSLAGDHEFNFLVRKWKLYFDSVEKAKVELQERIF